MGCSIEKRLLFNHIVSSFFEIVKSYFFDCSPIFLLLLAVFGGGFSGELGENTVKGALGGKSGQLGNMLGGKIGALKEADRMIDAASVDIFGHRDLKSLLEDAAEVGGIVEAFAGKGGEGEIGVEILVDILEKLLPHIGLVLFNGMKTDASQNPYKKNIHIAFEHGTP